MLQKTIDNFSLDQICRSGQCFRMREEEEGFYSVIAGDRFLRVRQDGKNCTFFCEEEAVRVSSIKKKPYEFFQ